MRTRRPAPTPASEFFARDPEFAASFGAFLRKNPELWRGRRIDQFRPLDLILAEHGITLTGTIDASLVDYFFDSADAFLEIENPRPRRGDEMTLYLPAFHHSKKHLMKISVTKGGRELSQLTRLQTARVEALHLAGLLDASRYDAEDRLGLQIVLAALIFQNPYVIEERVRQWIGTPLSFPPGEPLTAQLLAGWIQHEGDLFRPRLGEPLEIAFRPLIDIATRGETKLSLEAVDRPDALRHFPNLSSVLLHAIRDLLKVTAESAPSWKSSDASTETRTRREIYEDNAQLVARASAHTTSGLRVLEDLLGNEHHAVAARQIARSLHDRWSYLVTRVTLGEPFQLRASETVLLPLRLHHESGLRRRFEVWRKQYKRTAHEYELFPKDASAVHVEVSVSEPELRIRNRREGFPDNVALIVDRDGVRGEREMEFLFSHVERPTERILQLYSTRAFDEAPDRDEWNPFLKLYVPLRFAVTVFAAYVAAIVAFTLATLFIAYNTLSTIITQSDTEFLPQTITLGAIAVPLSLWLTNVQHRNLLVHKKLVLARTWLVANLCLTLLLLAALGSFKLYELLCL